MRIAALLFALLVGFSAQAFAGPRAFVILADGSGSMNQPYEGLTGIEILHRTLAKLINRIPEAGQSAALRVFGNNFSYEHPFQSERLYGVAPFRRTQMEAAMEGIRNELSWSWSAIGYGLEQTAEELSQLSGPASLIVLSDGDENSDYRRPLDVAKELAASYPDELCIFPILIAPTPKGRELLGQLPEITECGRLVTSDELEDPEVLTAFLEDAFEQGPPPAPPSPGDEDQDGVIDPLDDCPGTPHGAPVDEKGCWKMPTIYFDYDVAEVRPAYLTVLGETGAVMKNNVDIRIFVGGHASTEGTTAYNDDLSRRRAEAVRDALLRRGGSGERIDLAYFGERQPAIEEKTENDRALNRRVELRWERP